jgi:transcriptional regulator
MYQPPHFQEDRIDVVHDLMRAHPFATLVPLQGSGLAADRLPLVVMPELSDKGTVRGHIAKANPLWKERTVSPAVLAVF